MATATLPTVSLPTKPVSVNREELLQSLESVRPGLSIREVIQQSSCFVFKDGDVMTFNDEVTCRHKCKLNITGAVQAEPLLNILSKMVETEVEISIDKDSRLVVMGKKRRARIKMEMEIVLPIGTVEKPEKWQPIHEDFSDAIFMVKQCAGKDQTQLKSTCIAHQNISQP
jgi:DNA-binding transcriptional regulator/RsmH inhibitor MraZ